MPRDVFAENNLRQGVGEKSWTSACHTPEPISEGEVHGLWVSTCHKLSLHTQRANLKKVDGESHEGQCAASCHSTTTLTRKCAQSPSHKMMCLLTWSTLSQRTHSFQKRCEQTEDVFVHKVDKVFDPGTDVGRVWTFPQIEATQVFRRRGMKFEHPWTCSMTTSRQSAMGKSARGKIHKMLSLRSHCVRRVHASKNWSSVCVTTPGQAQHGDRHGRMCCWRSWVMRPTCHMSVRPSGDDQIAVENCYHLNIKKRRRKHDDEARGFEKV